MNCNHNKSTVKMRTLLIWLLLLLSSFHGLAQFDPNLPNSDTFQGNEKVLDGILERMKPLTKTNSKSGDLNQMASKALNQLLYKEFFVEKILAKAKSPELKNRLIERLNELEELKQGLRDVLGATPDLSRLNDYFLSQEQKQDSKLEGLTSNPLWGQRSSDRTGRSSKTAETIKFSDKQRKSAKSATPLLDLIPENGKENPVSLLRYIQREINYQPYWGSFRDSKDVLYDRVGNDLDQCGLLSELLWEMGISNKIHRGQVRMELDSLQKWMKVQDASSLAETLDMAGIPNEPLVENNTVVGFQLERFWLEAYLPISHYRGTQVGQGDYAWIPMDPAFSIMAQGEFSNPLNNIELDSEQWLLDYETVTQRDSWAWLNSQFADIFAGQTFEDLSNRFTPPEVGPGIMELSLPFKILERLGISDRVPDDMNHGVHILVTDSSGHVIIENDLPLKQFYGASLTWDAEPAGQADRELVQLYGTRWRVPLDLIHLRPVFKLAGVAVGGLKGNRSYSPGETLSVSIQVFTPRQDYEPIVNTLPVGGFSVLKVQAPQNEFLPKADYSLPFDQPFGTILSNLLETFMQRTFLAEQKIGSSFRTLALYPTAAFSWCHLDYETIFGANGRTLEMNVKAVKLDAEFRPMSLVGESASIQQSSFPHIRRLSGLETAQEEGLALEELAPEIEAVSVPDVFKQAHQNGMEPIDLRLSEIARLDEDINLNAQFEDQIRDYLQDGYQVRLLADPYWTGVSFVSVARIHDIQTGRTGWLLDNQYSGATTVVPIENWDEELQKKAKEPWSNDGPRNENDVFWLLRDPDTSVTWVTADRSSPIEIRYRAYNSVGRPVPGALVQLTFINANEVHSVPGEYQATTDQNGLATFLVTPPKNISLNDFQFDLGTGPYKDYAGIWIYYATCGEAKGNDLSIIVMEPGVPHHLVYAFKSSDPMSGEVVIWHLPLSGKANAKTPEILLFPGTECYIRSWVVDQNGNSIANQPIQYKSDIEFNSDEPCFDMYDSELGQIEDLLGQAADPPTAYFYRNATERELKLTDLQVLSDLLDNQVTVHPGMVENIDVVEGGEQVFRPIEDRIHIIPQGLPYKELVLKVDDAFLFTDIPAEQIESCHSPVDLYHENDFAQACLDFEPYTSVFSCENCSRQHNACFYPSFVDPDFQWVWPRGHDIIPYQQYNSDNGMDPAYPGQRAFSYEVKTNSTVEVYFSGLEGVGSCSFYMTCPDTVLNSNWDLELYFPSFNLRTQDGRDIPIQPDIFEIANSRFQVEFVLPEPGLVSGEMEYIAWNRDYPVFSRKTPFQFISYQMNFDTDVLPQFIIDGQNRLIQDTTFGPRINPNSSLIPFYSPKRWVYLLFKDGQEVSRSYNSMGTPGLTYVAGSVFDPDSEYEIEFRYDVNEGGILNPEGFSGRARMQLVRDLDLAVIDWQEHGLWLHPSPPAVAKKSDPGFNCNSDPAALFPGFPVFSQSVFYNQRADYQSVTLYGFETKPIDASGYPGPMDQIAYSMELPAEIDPDQEIPLYPIQNVNVPVEFTSPSARLGGLLYWGLVGVRPDGRVFRSNIATIPYKFPLQGIGVTNGEGYEQDYVFYLEEDPAAVEDPGKINVQRDLGFKLSQQAEVLMTFDGHQLFNGVLQPGIYKSPVSCNFIGKRDWEFQATFQTSALPDGTPGTPVTIEETGSIEIIKNIKSKLNVGSTNVKGVNLASGSLNLGVQDISLPGIGKGLNFSRSYSSAGGLNWDPMGLGWTHNFSSRLLQSDDDMIKIVGGDGSGMVFKLNPTTQGYEAVMPGIHSQLVKNQDGSFTLITKDGSKWGFGFPIDQNGRDYAPFSFQTNLLYIEDSFGNRLDLTYDQNTGLLYRVTDPSGRALNFTYGTMRNYNVLKAVTTSGVTPKIRVQFEHDAFGRLIKSTRGEKVETYSYQDHCEVKSERDKLVSYTNANGQTTHYTYHDATSGQGNPLVAEYVHEIIEPEGLVTSFLYGNYLDPLKSATVSDALSSTSYYFNFEEQVEKIDGPLGTTLMTWYPNDVLKQSETDPSGRMTEYGYDVNGNMIQKISHSRSEGETQTESWVYDLDWNKPLSYTDKKGHKTTYKLEEHGAVASKTDPEMNTTQLTYDEYGNLKEIKDARGFTTKMEYDAFGFPIKTTLPDGTELHKTFDSRGRLLTEEKHDTNNNSIGLTKYQYDDLDHLTQMDTDAEHSGGQHVLYQDIKPMGQVGKQIDGKLVTTFEYDGLNRLVEERIDPGENQPVIVKSYSYDLHSNMISKTMEAESPGGGETHQFTMTYDNADRLHETRLNNKIYQKLTYIPNTHLIKTQTDWKGAKTEWGYDGFDRPTTKVLPVTGGYIEHTGYDSNGNIIMKQDGNGHRATSEYDGNNRLIANVNALGYRTVNNYDGNGNLLQTLNKVDGSGVSYVYDALNRVTRETRFNSTGSGDQSTSFVYSRSGQEVEITPPEDQSTTTQRNALGQVVSRTQGGITTGYTYDANGNVTHIQHPEGYETVQIHDGFGRLVSETAPLDYQQTFQYDIYNNSIHHVDARGIETSTTFDSYDRPLSQTRALDGTTIQETWSYSQSQGQVTVVATDVRGNQVTQRFDGLGRLLSTEDSTRQGTMSQTWDAVVKVSQTDFKGNPTAFTYDALNRLTLVTDALAGTQQTVYNDEERQTVFTDRKGIESITTLDQMGNTLSVSRAGVLQSTQVYDLQNRPLSSTDASGVIQAHTYDSLGRIQTQSIGSGSDLQVTTYSEYDDLGRPAKVDDGLQTVTRSYDFYGRITAETNGNGETDEFTYDPSGNVLTKTSPAPHGGTATWTYTYDLMNQLTKVIEPNEAQTLYQWESNWTLLRITDAENEVSTRVFDPAGRLLQIQVPGLGTTFYTYDANDNPESTQRPIGEVSYTYDELNRLETESWSGNPNPDYTIDQVTYGYDANSNPTLITQTGSEGESTRTIDYDDWNRPTSVEDHRGFHLDVGYRDNGTRDHVIYPNGTRIDYDYDNANRLSQATIPGVGQAQFGYYANGLLQSMQEGPNSGFSVEANLTYDPANRLETLAFSRADGQSTTFDLTWLPDGSRESMVESRSDLGVWSTTYQYDDNSRLTSWTRQTPTGERTTTYNLDKVGNRTYESETESGSNYLRERTYTYKSGHRLEQFTESQSGDGYPAINRTVTYQYDPNGNRIQKADYNNTTTDLAVTTMQWDARNRMRQVVTPTGLTSEFEYDDLNRRIRKSEDNRGTGPVLYTWDQNAVVNEYTEGTGPGQHFEQATYAFGLARMAMLRPGHQPQWITHDPLRSLSDLIADDGSLIEAKTFTPFGTPETIFTSPNGGYNNHGFTGHEYDPETNLTYAKARFYDQDLGIFLGQDPEIGQFDTPPSLHRFQYAYANPLVFWDPTGSLAENSADIVINSKTKEPDESSKDDEQSILIMPFAMFGFFIEDTIQGIGGVAEFGSNLFGAIVYDMSSQKLDGFYQNKIAYQKTEDKIIEVLSNPLEAIQIPGQLFQNSMTNFDISMSNGNYVEASQYLVQIMVPLAPALSGGVSLEMNLPLLEGSLTTKIDDFAGITKTERKIENFVEDARIVSRESEVGSFAKKSKAVNEVDALESSFVEELAPNNAVPHGTPFRQLTKKTRSRLKNKIDSRTLTKDEWKRHRWQKRLDKRRKAGIDEFWAVEQRKLLSDQPGTRNWNQAAREAILSGKRPSGIFSHHKYSVSKYPQLANDPMNIYPTTFYEHFYRWHDGGWKPTHGVPLNPDFPEWF